MSPPTDPRLREEWNLLHELRNAPQLLNIVAEPCDNELARQTQLRRDYPDRLVRGAFALCELRRKAGVKFSARRGNVVRSAGNGAVDVRISREAQSEEVFRKRDRSLLGDRRRRPLAGRAIVRSRLPTRTPSPACGPCGMPRFMACCPACDVDLRTMPTKPILGNALVHIDPGIGGLRQGTCRASRRLRARARIPPASHSHLPRRRDQAQSRVEFRRQVPRRRGRARQSARRVQRSNGLVRRIAGTASWRAEPILPTAETIGGEPLDYTADDFCSAAIRLRPRSGRRARRTGRRRSPCNWVSIGSTRRKNTSRELNSCNPDSCRPSKC